MEFGLSIIGKITEVDGFWNRMIPRTYPHQDDLLKRVPVPTFYQNDNLSVAIYSAGGEENIPIAFDSLVNVMVEGLSGVAVFFDSDEKMPEEKFNEMHQKLQLKIESDFLPIIEGVAFNQVKEAPIKCGLFVFPNNHEKGTLENLLLEGGNIAYLEFLIPAQRYLESIPSLHTEKWNEAKKSKALFGVMANVLKPGSANQVTIQRDNWISKETIKQTNQEKIKGFLVQLMDIHSSAD